MINNSSIACIIADDLTGANDTALQFKLNGADANILLNNSIIRETGNFAQAWAVSTETRNIDRTAAFEKVRDVTKVLLETLKPDYFYKKIDSTVRGNIAVEVAAVIDVLGWDGAVIMPAFPQEGRITVGGYQLLKGVPIERTEMAMDPHSPITESHLPTLFKKQLGPDFECLVGHISLNTVLDGAGPVLKQINHLIEEGKKIIVADSVSTVDIEQIVLAMKKSDYRILPVGNAAAAKVLSNEWFPIEQNSEVLPIEIPKLPKFIISGSATQITANQIIKLEQSDEYDDRYLAIELDINTVLSGIDEELVERIVSNLKNNNIVLVHTSNLIKNFNGFSDEAISAGLTKSGLANVITDFLATLTKTVLMRTKAILITLGGETSYKCCNAIGANQLKLLDEVLPAIALSKNVVSDQLIVTKSGNLGNINVLTDIIKYLEKHEK